jgi:hypothetical protein
VSDTERRAAAVVEVSRRQARAGAVRSVPLALAGGYRTLRIRLPAGVRDGQFLQLNRQQLPDPASWPPDEIPIRIRVSNRKPILRATLGAVVVAGIVVGSARFALALAALSWLVWWCAGHPRRAGRSRAVARSAKATGRSRLAARLRHHLCAVGILYLVPIGVALTFYVLLSVWLGLFGDRFGTGRLIALQRWFENVSRFFSDTLQLDESRIFLALVGTYLIGCLLLVRRDRRGAAAASASRPRRIRLLLVSGLHRLADGYCRYSNPIAAGLATLASFTFFGLQLGPPSHDLQLRIKTTQQGYAEVASRTQAALSERVVFVLYHEILDSFPQDYRDAFQLLRPQIDRAAADSQEYAAEVRRKYGFTDPAVDAVVRGERARQAKVNRLETVLTVPDTPAAGPPGDLPNGQIDAARTVVSGQSSDPGIELVSAGKRKVVLQVEKLVSERLASLLKPVADAFPILSPAFQVLIEAVDETAQEQLGQAYDQVVRQVIQNPHEFTGAVQQHAEAIAAHAHVAVLAARARPAAEQQARKLQQTLAALAGGKGRLERRVADKLRRDQERAERASAERERRAERALVSRLAGKLVSSDTDTQIAGANELINLPDEHIKEEVINRVLTTMRTSGGQTRVNAARIIGALGSYEPRYIPPAVVREAKSICGCR